MMNNEEATQKFLDLCLESFQSGANNIVVEFRNLSDHDKIQTWAFLMNSKPAKENFAFAKHIHNLLCWEVINVFKNNPEIVSQLNN